MNGGDIGKVAGLFHQENLAGEPHGDILPVQHVSILPGKNLPGGLRQHANLYF
jgi:hypothetical protein